MIVQLSIRTSYTSSREHYGKPDPTVDGSVNPHGEPVLPDEETVPFSSFLRLVRIVMRLFRVAVRLTPGFAVDNHLCFGRGGVLVREDRRRVHGRRGSLRLAPGGSRCDADRGMGGTVRTAFFAMYAVHVYLLGAFPPSSRRLVSPPSVCHVSPP